MRFRNHALGTLYSIYQFRRHSMLLLTQVQSHNGGSGCLIHWTTLLYILSMFTFSLCAATPQHSQTLEQSIPIDEIASKAPLAVSYNTRLTTRNTRIVTLTPSKRNLNTTVARPQILSMYAMLIPSQAHVDLLHRIFPRYKELPSRLSKQQRGQ